MDSSVKRFLTEMDDRASAMAEGAMDAVAGAGKVVGEKKDAAMLRLDLLRLRSECESRFSEIGRTFYLMNAGAWPKEGETAEHRIESLLGQVGEREMQISDILRRLAELSGKSACPACGKPCEAGAAFCPACGKPLKG